MITLKGEPELKSALAGIPVAQQVAARMAVAEAAHLLEKTVKQKLTTTSHPKGTPTPSSPGDPPSLVSGNLRRSITVTGPTAAAVGGLPGWQAQIGPTAIYGRIQELGGRTAWSTLPPRPYLAPALHEIRPQIVAIFVRRLREAMSL